MLVSLSCLSAADRAASSMSHSMTFAPACAKAVAIPSPMPDAAPVTNAVFPASSFTRFSPVQAGAMYGLVYGDHARGLHHETSRKLSSRQPVEAGYRQPEPRARG